MLTIEKTRLECTRASGNRSTAVHIPLHIFIFGWITTEQSGVTAQHSKHSMSDGVYFTLVSKRKKASIRLVLLIPPLQRYWKCFRFCLCIYSQPVNLAARWELALSHVKMM